MAVRIKDKGTYTIFYFDNHRSLKVPHELMQGKPVLDAALFTNEYDHELRPSRKYKVYHLVKSTRERKEPEVYITLDGVKYRADELFSWSVFWVEVKDKRPIELIRSLGYKEKNAVKEEVGYIAENAKRWSLIKEDWYVAAYEVVDDDTIKFKITVPPKLKGRIFIGEDRAVGFSRWHIFVAVPSDIDVEITTK